MSQWHTQATQILHEVAADDLVGIGCYLVPFSDVVQYEPRLRGGRCSAWTSPVLDIMLADYLSRKGRWSGRGFATIIHQEQLPRWMQYVGAVLHEFAHYLSWDLPQPEQIEDSVLLAVQRLAILPDAMAAKKYVPAYCEPLPKWHDHDATFVRACCHLAYRAMKITYLQPRDVQSVRPYHQYAYEVDFMRALESELAESAGSIRQILATDPPQSFSDEWQAVISAGPDA